MPYIDGFLVAVPTANKEVYRSHADQAAPIFHGYGATRLMEAWGDDVPRGKVNDLWGAVQATDDETVVFSWIEFPDRATRDAAHQRMADDPEMHGLGEMPFDGKRMVWGGFESVCDEGSGERTGYVDGVVIPMPSDGREAYREFAARCAPVFIEHGAVRVVDAFADDVRDGKLTDFHRAIHRQDGETAAFGWVEWRSKQERDAGWEKVMGDPRMQDQQSPFDGSRMIFGGFEPIVDR